jgi:hypothetical protein
VFLSNLDIRVEKIDFQSSYEIAGTTAILEIFGMFGYICLPCKGKTQ